MKQIAVAGLVTLEFSSAAYARPADCLLFDDGRTIIDGPCDFSPLDREGSFTITGKPHFAYLFVDTPSKGAGFWNGDRRSYHADSHLGELSLHGACWENDRSKICAWKPGERRRMHAISP